MQPRRAASGPTLATVFEVVIDGKVFRVEGASLQKWIVRRGQQMEWAARIPVHPAAELEQ